MLDFMFPTSTITNMEKVTRKDIVEVVRGGNLLISNCFIQIFKIVTDYVAYSLFFSNL